MATNQNQVNDLSKSRPISSVSTSEHPSAELSAVVDDLLTSLSTKFSTVSTEIFTKMDEMSKRLDNLESALQESKTNSGSPTKG